MAVDFDRYKRLIQRLWDSEPINNGSEQGSLWCLGTEYPPFARNDETAPSQGETETVLAPKDSSNVLPSSASIPKSSMDSAVVCVEQPVPDGYDDKGWPTSFLDDMEARLWFSYRSGFPAIPKCQDETPSSTMSFSMRIRSQLVDRAGFTSDTGWGCMIRSGQSLLANALLISRLGRGMDHLGSQRKLANICRVAT
jgi:cysteine protease ATG4